MRNVIGAACGLFLGLSGTVYAQSEPVVVLELFTSQGCSSCPPADDYLTTLMENPQVVALALHVDYWDYIGWEDKFAQAAFTARQKSYAKAIGSRTIYTPQFIINGADRIEGNQPEALTAVLKRHAGVVPPVVLSLTRQGDRVAITARADQPLTRPLRVQLVRYRPSETVEIERGENAGKTVTYRNIVTAWDGIGEWQGQAPLEITAPAAGDDPLVVILQADGPSDIVAAARLD